MFRRYSYAAAFRDSDTTLSAIGMRTAGMVKDDSIINALPAHKKCTRQIICDEKLRMI